MAVRPLMFMWIAEFEDASLVAQFEPTSGKENKADPDWLPSAGGVSVAGFPVYDKKSKIGQLKEKGVRLKRVGWHNFSPELASVLQAQGHPVQPTYPPISVVLNVKKGEQPVVVRRMMRKWGLVGAKVYDRGTGPTVYILGVKEAETQPTNPIRRMLTRIFGKRNKGGVYAFIGEDGSIELSSDYNYK